MCWAHHEKCQARWIKARIKIGGRNTNNLRYVDDTTLMAGSKEELDIKLPTFTGLERKQGNFRKTSISVSSTTLKYNKLWKVLREMGIPDHLTGSWETCMQAKKQQLEPCMEQMIGSRSRKEYDRAVCCHPVGLTYTLSTWWDMPGWMSYKLESR